MQTTSASLRLNPPRGRAASLPYLALPGFRFRQRYAAAGHIRGDRALHFARPWRATNRNPMPPKRHEMRLATTRRISRRA